MGFQDRMNAGFDPLGAPHGQSNPCLREAVTKLGGDVQQFLSVVLGIRAGGQDPVVAGGFLFDP
jgi:hypothetical protein